MHFPLIVVLAFNLSSADPGWQKFIKDTDAAYAEWTKDNESGDWGRYINDKMMTFSTPKDADSLKKFSFWLALYQEKKQPIPEWLKEALKKYEGALKDVDTSKLTWQELFDIVRKEAQQ